MIKFPTSAVNSVSICLLAISTGAGVKLGISLCTHIHSLWVPIVYNE